MFPFLLLLAQAPTTDRTVAVTNDTATGVNQLFGLRPDKAGPLARRHDDEDRLAAILDPGATAAVDFARSGACVLDLKAILVDGRTLIARGFDVCVQHRWAIGSAEPAR